MSLIAVKRFLFLDREMKLKEFLKLLEEVTLCIWHLGDDNEVKVLGEWLKALKDVRKNPCFYFHSNEMYEGKEYSEAGVLFCKYGKVVVTHKKKNKSDGFPVNPTGEEMIDGFAIMPQWAREQDRQEDVQKVLETLSEEIQDALFSDKIEVKIIKD
jgi:hypothetical protein